MMKTIAISQATAEQRTGRAGRVRNGACLRLYTEDHFDRRMPAFPSAEISRSRLEGTIATILATDLTFRDFKFVVNPGKSTNIS